MIKRVLGVVAIVCALAAAFSVKAFGLTEMNFIEIGLGAAGAALVLI